MPRRHHRRDEPPKPLGPVAAGGRRESHRDGDWMVVTIPGERALKEYRCPGCDHEIPVGTPHVVAWSVDDPTGDERRRHWHTPCWKRRVVPGPRR